MWKWFFLFTQHGIQVTIYLATNWPVWIVHGDEGVGLRSGPAKICQLLPVPT